MDSPISEFPQTSGPITLNYTGGNGSWTAGDFTFGLCGSVCGSVGVLQQGQNLQTYTETFLTTIGDGLGGETNSASTGAITVGAGEYYVQLSLDLTMAVNAAANVTLGSVGIQGSAGTSDSFRVSFFKKADGVTLLRDAFKAAFEGFVLPLHSQTYQKLQPGDYLYHQFNATLNLGFGVTLGLDKVYFSGQYQADIPSEPAAPVVKTSVVAEVKSGATFGATFKYTGSYEAMLWKTDDNTGRLHLYRNKVTDANFNIGGTVAVIADPITISPVGVGTLAAQVLPGGTGSVVNKMLSGMAQDQTNSWAEDVQTKIASWLKPFQQGATALQLAIDDTRSTFLLLDFTSDLTAIGFPVAWSQAIAGDYCAALAVQKGGLSLDTGSGLENFHMVKTSVTFKLFGAFKAEWDSEDIANFSILYAGNNTFHLIENIGRAQISTLGRSGEEMDLYFAAVATSGPSGTTVGEIDLHVTLTATQNKRFGNEIAGVLTNATTGATASTLNKQLLALAQQENSTQTLNMIFQPSACGRLSSSTLGGGGAIGNEGADQSNFNAFAAACSQVESVAPGNFTTSPSMDYATWRTWNIAANDAYPPPPGSEPNRRDEGARAEGENYLGQQFGSSIPAPLIRYAFQAASDFMNLCEDLNNLATLIEDNSSWNELIADLGAIIKNDLSADFIPATALALTTCLGQAGVQPQIVGPAPNAGQESTIKVTLRYT